MATRSFIESFTVAVPIQRAWDVVSDTQHLNALFLNLQSSKVVSRDEKKVRLRGTFGRLAPEYDEFPWAFEAPRHYKNRRVFTRGLLRRLEVECTLTPVDDERSARTRIDYGVLIESSTGPWSSIVAWEAARRTRGGIERVRAFIERCASTARIEWPPANPQREAVLQRARSVVAGLRIDDPEVRTALDEILVYVADAPESDVARMRPYELADTWRLRRAKALAAFLHATHGGMLRLSWDLLCPACDGATTIASLKDLPSGAHCDACDIDFRLNFGHNVEATFAPEPAVRRAERILFCHGSPSSTRSWLAQFVVQPEKKHELTMGLGVGRYHIQAAGIPGATSFEVAAGDDGRPTNFMASIGGTSKATAISGALPVVRSGPLQITVENRDPVERRVQLVHRAFASKAATAADVTACGLYREFFAEEALSPGQHVEVGQRAILFTDLCGSTALYERVGDAPAYALVREHFNLLFAEVEKHGGQVIKTVGDCVMAAFASPAEAARAGRACILALRTLRDRDGRPPGLALKVGVHTGSCLAIEANNQVDYFGRTVNIAARVESLANPDELVLSWAVAADSDAIHFLEEIRSEGGLIVDDRRPVKGVEGEIAITRIRIPA